jgi:uncharacterized membrane protein YfcA
VLGIPGATWLTALMLLPVAVLGGFAGRPIGDRLGAEAFGRLTIAVLVATGAYTTAAAVAALVARL